MSNKALFVNVKNMTEAIYLDLLAAEDFSGDIHHIGTAKNDNIFCGTGDSVAVATSRDSFMIDELSIARMNFAYLGDFYFLGATDKDIEFLYKTIS